MFNQIFKVFGEFVLWCFLHSSKILAKDRGTGVSGNRNTISSFARLCINTMFANSLLATAMKSKHLDLFMQQEEINDTYVHLVDTLKTIQASPFHEKMKNLEETGVYTSFMMSYESFCDDTSTCILLA